MTKKTDDAEVVLGVGAKGDLAQPHLTHRDLEDQPKVAAKVERQEREEAHNG